MSRSEPTMVNALRRRILLVVACALVLVGAASLWGTRIITDRNADRQALLAAQNVADWGTDIAGIRTIDASRLAATDTTSTVVALLDQEGDVVAATTAPAVTVETLEGLSPGNGETVRTDLGRRSMVFTTVDLPAGTVYDDGTPHPVSRALVGIGVEASDRFVATLAVTVAGLLVVILALIWVLTTLVVSRTTRALSAVAERVESGDLSDLAAAPAAEYREMHAITDAITRLDERRSANERVLREFVADASHELRTPLTTIQGWTELHFQSPDDSATTDRAFASIGQEADRMRSLIDRLTQLARADLTPAGFEPVDLTALCRAVIDDTRELAQDLTITYEGPEAPVLVSGDPLTLAQLLRNLLGNAVVHAAGATRINVVLEDLPEAVALTVADDGAGMPPAIRDRAFDRFVTGDRRTGTGLGLAIVQATATAHHGTARIESTPGRGTRVTVLLPHERTGSVAGGLRR